MSKYQSLIRFNSPIYVVSSATAVGSKEIEGPLGLYYDLSAQDDRFGTKTYEQAESEMVKMGFECCMKKSGISVSDVDLVIGGDLQNQCVAHSFAMASTNTPYIGIYGACSSMAQGLALGAMLLDGGKFNNIVCSASSHFSTSERQFRFPLEYGLQRTPTSQTTVTGAASFLLSRKISSDIVIKSSLLGTICDAGIKDANNMGGAMAKAALSTLQRYFFQTNSSPSDFDLVLTGDLGIEGASIVRENASIYSMKLGENYFDCGELVYDTKKQRVFSGGSGCGCSAVVMGGYIMERLRTNELRKVLFVGTGALLSSGSILQRLSIPGIAHLVEIARR